MDKQSGADTAWLCMKQARDIG